MDARAWLEAAKPLTDRIASATGLTHAIVVAVLIMLAGLVAAALLSRLARKLVARSARWLGTLQPGAVSLPDFERVEGAVGRAVYWLVVVCAVMAATETLGLPVVTAWLSGVATFLPRIAVAIMIIALGTVAARVTRHVVTSTASAANVTSAERLGRVAELSALLATVLVAIEQLGIEISFLKATLLLLLAGMLLGAALAFGFGGRDLVANILSAHYVHRLYQVGQVVRVDGIEGRIVRITETSVILETSEGDVSVPARTFAESRSTLIVRRGSGS
ncbi:MAG TPA: mechanosensitive ion channel domain-containing protein [Polyangiaceae bacterium]